MFDGFNFQAEVEASSIIIEVKMNVTVCVDSYIENKIFVTWTRLGLATTWIRDHTRTRKAAPNAQG